MITLKEFITETIGSITEAVIEFDNNYRKETGASAMPNILINYEKQSQIGEISFALPPGGQPIINVEFDLVVEAQERESSEAKAQGSASMKAKILTVISGGVEVGGSKKKNSEASAAVTNRVKFKIPFQLPRQKES